MRAVLALLVVKAIVWLVALGSGTSGGILAPVLILGGALGYIAGLFLPGGAGFWALMGMAGIMSGAMRAPITGALFAAELTGHFTALPHTMAAAEIGRASCRERVCQYVTISVVAVSLKKKKTQ